MLLLSFVEDLDLATSDTQTPTARVKLFKKSFTPEYEVIVGQLTRQALGFYQSVGCRSIDVFPP